MAHTDHINTVTFVKRTVMAGPVVTAVTQYSTFWNYNNFMCIFVRSTSYKWEWADLIGIYIPTGVHKFMNLPAYIVLTLAREISFEAKLDYCKLPVGYRCCGTSNRLFLKYLLARISIFFHVQVQDNIRLISRRWKYFCLQLHFPAIVFLHYSLG